MKHFSLIVTIVPLVIVFIGLIGWILTLRNDVTTSHTEIVELHEEVNQLHERLNEEFDALYLDIDEIRDIQSLQENEMRTIMADHMGFGESLKELGEATILPSGERRDYGSYGK